MLADGLRRHAVLILLLILAAAVILGSRYLGEYSSMSYILIGAFVYLMLKAFSDLKSANKTIYIGFDDSAPLKLNSEKVEKEDKGKEDKREKADKEQVFFRLLYDAALFEGSFSFSEDKTELFRLNNAVTRITGSALLKAAKSEKRITILKRDAEALMLGYSPVGGLLLFLHLNGRLRYLDERAV